VEIGSEWGKQTSKAADYCQEAGAVLHVVDPSPKYDPVDWTARYGDRIRFYKDLSLNALPRVPRYDVVLIDGDHNWFTVFNELKLIERHILGSGQQVLVFLHDVGWPYARRDQYYDPRTVPVEFRQAFRPWGVVLDRGDLTPQGGFNRTLNNAVYENTERNGVLTAVEDFLAQAQLEFQFIFLPGFHGLGVLSPVSLVRSNPELASVLDSIRPSAPVARILESLERARIQGLTRIEQSEAQWQSGQAALQQTQAELQARLGELAPLRGRAAELEERLAASVERQREGALQMTELERELARAKRRAESLEQALDSRVRSKDLELVRRRRELEELSHALDSSRNTRRRLLGELTKRLAEMERQLQRACDDLHRAVDSSHQAHKEALASSSAEGRPYHNLQEFLVGATLHPELMTGPLQEDDRRVLGVMDYHKKRLAREYRDRPQDTLVTVVMPTYNRAAIIGGSIRSVLAQSYRTWELLVVDDGGTDDTAKVVAQFTDERIRYLRLEQNQGAAEARNHALRQARGNFFCYLDSDDEWDPDFILIMLHKLREEPELHCIYSAQMVWNPTEGATAGQAFRRVEENLRFLRFSPFNRSLLENRNYISLIAFMHDRSVMERHGMFLEGARRLVDWELILRYTAEEPAFGLPIVLSHYQQGYAGNQISRTEDLQQAYRSVDRTLHRNSLSVQLTEHPVAERLQLSGLMGPERRSSASRQVAIVIPSYEVLDYLRLNIDALRRWTPLGSYRLVVVDNASSPPVLEFLRQLSREDDVQVILNKQNLGFTSAVNQGIEAAGPDADIVLLNNDALVTPGWLGAMQEVLDRVADAGLIAPRQTLLPDTKTLKTHVPGGYKNRECDTTLSAHHANVLDPYFDPHRGYIELSFAPFFCVYIPRTTIRKIGLLDVENGPHYRSDRLYCDVVRNFGGLRIIYTPHSKLYHFLQRATEELKQSDRELFKKMYVKNDWAAIRDQHLAPTDGVPRTTGERS